MQVILTQNVPNLGSLGDEVMVKAGYARNYLLPRGLALAANTGNAKELHYRRSKLEVLRQAAIDAAKSEASKASDLMVEVTAKSGPGGRLFGSVTNRTIQEALVPMGYELDRRSIVLHEPIKAVGTYMVTLRLHTDVKVEITVKVKGELDAEAMAQAEAEKAEAAAQEAAEAAKAQEAEAAEEAPAEEAASE